MDRPSKLPSWSSDTNFAAGAFTWSATPTKVDPGTGPAAGGFVPGTGLAFQILNWILNLISDLWIKYFDTFGFWFGTGADGVVTFDGATNYAAFSTRSGSVYTLTRNVHGTTVTLNPGVEVATAGFIIYGTVKFLGTNVSGILSCNVYTGGGTLGGASGGTAGAASNGAGGAGTAKKAALGGSGGAGGNGGGVGVGGAAGVATAPVNPYKQLPTGSTGFVFESSGCIPFCGGAPGGGGAGGDPGVTGGAGGAPGGVVMVVAREIDFVGTCRALGGSGVSGISAGFGANGGGGGGGGGGGAAVFSYVKKTTLTVTMSTAGGGGGVGGATGGGGGVAGSNGGNGVAGAAVPIEIPLS